ncbi:MAG TPA: VOC family protein [Polyangiales bacterium]|jgi:predicted 3-demethylubiquinone-9 3-methyltransferase (glyoxalase superfamily)|nr:VOC family protein [Polyangiales bacterium]
MDTQSIVPCLWLDDQAEKAAAFYIEAFGAGRVRAVSHYPAAGDNPSGKPPGSVLTVDFEVAGLRFTALNAGPVFRINPSISFMVHTESAKETDALFAALSAGGDALMPLDKYPWSERYGWAKDRFGATWQVFTGKRGPSEAMIVPSLMFANEVRGRAEEALRFYASVFPNGRVASIQHYDGKNGPANMVVHGRCELSGQELIAFDSHIEHGFGFDEGLSLQVMCKDQRAIDHFWNGLVADGGEHGVCGWLKDRFGVSWQVVPANIAEWLTSQDTAARDRAFHAMMKMKKPVIAELEAAFAGKR